jgi:hypothetical protein
MNALPLMLALYFLPATPQSGVLGIQKLNFAPQRGALVSLEPPQEQPLVAGVRGTLSMAVTFQSNLVRPDGTYYARDLAAMWRVRDNEDHALYTRAYGLGGEWNGLDPVVEAPIDTLNAQTGEGQALLSLPIGGYATEGLETVTRYPLLPDIGTTITIVVGWKSTLQLDASGEPTGALAQGTLTLATCWPEIWIGSEVPRGYPQVGDAGYEFVLALRTPATTARTFDIACQPPGVATVLTPQVTVPVGNGWATVAIQGARAGSFRLVVRESGVVVAQSAVDTVVPPTAFFDGAHPEGQWMTSDGLALAALVYGWWDDEYCVEGWEPDGPSQPTFEFCFPCKAQPNPEPTCPAEGGGTAAFYSDAYCVEGDEECRLAVAPISNFAYTFSAKRETPCGSRAYTITASPWGVGGSTTYTQTLSAWCCKYSYSHTAPGFAGGRAVCGQ